MNLAYLTSCRWVDAGVEGVLSLLLRHAGAVNVAAVVMDDDDAEYARAWSEKGELWPRHAVDAITLRIPSQPWRAIARHDPAKARAKAAYERRIVAFLRARGVELVLADSYLPIIGRELLSAFPRRILNVHPGITERGDPARVPGRTPTRDAYTRAAFGFILVDDKRDAPAGRRVAVECDGETRQAVEAERIREFGVTVHVVTDEVDGGPVVACERYRLEENEIAFETIRRRNAEIRAGLVPRALLEYASGSALPARTPRPAGIRG